MKKSAANIAKKMKWIFMPYADDGLNDISRTFLTGFGRQSRIKEQPRTQAYKQPRKVK